MTTFKKHKELQELSKDYLRNRVEIINIIYNYLEENEDELAMAMTNERLKDMVDVKNVLL